MKLFDRFKVSITLALNRFAGGGNTNSIFKNVGILASGTFLAKMIGLATYPIITRLYSPADFGVLAVFTSAIAIFVPFATLRYSVTIPLPKNDGIAFNIFALGCFLVLGFIGLLYIVLFVFSEAIFGFFNMNEIAHYWWLLIVGIAGAGFYELLSNWATRKKCFEPVAKTTIWQTSLSSIVKISLGYLGLKPIGLLIGAVINKGGGVISLFRFFLKDFKDNVVDLSKRRIKFLFSYYKDLPLFRLPSQFLLVFATKIPVLFFAFQFGSEPTGQLGLSLTVVGIPIGLIGSNTAKAYYAEIAKIGVSKRDEILSLTKSIIKRLSIISFLPTLVLLFFSPNLFQIIFGQEWNQAGVFTSILAFYLFAQFVTSPLVNVFNVYNKQKKFLEINIVRTFLVVFVFSISYLFDIDVYQTLIFYVAMISSHYFYVGLQVYRIIK